jgi:hypothetical protein
VQDVIEYVNTHQHGDSVGRGSAQTVERVEFVLRSSFPERYPVLHTYAPDDALLCVVTLRGMFRVSVPPTLREKFGDETSDIAYQVFDAQTGNLLTEAVGKR